MDYLRVLKRALEITWKYRALWLVGLLLVVAGGGVTGGFRGGAPAAGGGGGRGEWQPPVEEPEKVLWVVIAVAVLIVVILLLAIIIGIVTAIVRYVTRTSLIQMVQSYEETGEEIGFWSGLRMGWSQSAFHFFLVDLLLRLPLALLMILLIGPMVALGVLSFVSRSGPAIGLGILFLLLIIPAILLAVAVRVVLVPILEITYRACVIQGVEAWKAIQEGFGLIRRNLGPAAVQWLLLVCLGIAWRIVLIPVNLLLVALALFVGGLPSLFLGGMAALILGGPVGLVLGLLVFVPVFIVVVAVPKIALTTFATVYYSTAWTLTYRELCVIDTREEGDASAVGEA